MLKHVRTQCKQNKQVTKRQILCDSVQVRHFEESELQRCQNDDFQGMGQEEQGSYNLIGKEFALQDEKVMKIDGGDSCTNLYI